jgi:ABC-type transport system involved in cytochrome c biogenesis ATPase subunit
MATSAAAAQPQLEVMRLRIRRGRRVVLDRFDLQHAPGRLVWITGENGAGKSSLLRVLAGRLQPESGSVVLRPRPASLAYYHPAMSLPRGVVVADWWRMLGHVPSAPASLVPTLRGNERIEALSTGERKRLLLHGILARPTRFTFLDEPFEHLSPTAKARLTPMLMERAATGIVLVATNQDVPSVGAPVVVHLDQDEVQA